MDRAHRFRIAVGLMLLGAWTSSSALAQFGAPSPPNLTDSPRTMCTQQKSLKM